MFPFFGKSRKFKVNGDKSVGRTGEDAAVAYLMDMGYTIIDRNYRRRFGEIDIVADDHGVLVFVEVKTRRSRLFGSPFEAVDFRKQKKMSKMALDYISRHNRDNCPARFDVVAVMLHDNFLPRIELIQNAFEVSS